MRSIDLSVDDDAKVNGRWRSVADDEQEFLAVQLTLGRQWRERLENILERVV